MATQQDPMRTHHREEISINPKKEGAFSAKAAARDEGVQEFATQVLNAPEGRFSPATRKQANFAKNAAKWNK